ncbi:hypothetical protein QR78_07570 [Methylobacterium indicum]|uniref:Uncharacterized protein n=1 Tax=Methylobacterium indicum TaxID=1775910 RepID=A0ABR5HDJ5_9HYPH|nr:hypothetical protein QR78_07570 [Methylobacterium indicum]KMO24308.1 hypothetical protein QR79_11905 [Methylobacterium indicum]
MQSIDSITWKALEQAIFQHGARAAATFLGGLKYKLNCAVELRMLRQIASGAKQHGDMPIMAAGVHDASDLGGVGETCLLMDRQGVHVGAQTDSAHSRSIAPECANHSRLTDPFRDL